MELKWKDLILAAFLLSKRNPSMAKAGFGPAPPRGCPAGTLPLRLPNARPLAAEGPLIGSSSKGSEPRSFRYRTETSRRVEPIKLL